MPLFTPTERKQAEAVSEIIYCNPFVPRRLAAEKHVLGESFGMSETVWSIPVSEGAERPNVIKLAAIVERLVRTARDRLVEGTRPSPRELLLYEDLVLHALYYRRQATLEKLIVEARAGRPGRGVGELYDAVVADLRTLLGPEVLPDRPVPDAAHLLACFFQIRRAFKQILHTIVGSTATVGRLREAVWQSIFTHDMRRYRRTLFDKTGDFTTLICGPSGTGKELVASAIGVSRYIPFDPKKRTFTEDFAGSFFPLNLSALSPMLVESELFGHRRGAFTGAVEDRPGWLQTCPALGTVFLDEIGELDANIQVKLLRVLQTRQFSRLGDTQTRTFRGKIIAATNRNLDAEMATGRFRRDFYYRLCSDMIVTPSLREQIEDSSDELRTLVHFIARRLIPDDAESLADEVMQSIDKHLGPEYPWPGNFRELEQCVRNVLIRGEYRPPAPVAGETVSTDDGLIAQLRAGSLHAEALLDQYCAHVYKLTGSYHAAAKQLKLDRRTVRARVMSADAASDEDSLTADSSGDDYLRRRRKSPPPAKASNTSAEGSGTGDSVART